MGAEVFYNRVKGTDSSKAFNEAVEEACYEYGHGGYTGTIVEKSSFSMSKKPKDIDADEWIEAVDEFNEDESNQKYYFELSHDFNIYDDKWGDALCVPVEDGFIFCGWASC